MENYFIFVVWDIWIFQRILGLFGIISKFQEILRKLKWFYALTKIFFNFKKSIISRNCKLNSYLKLCIRVHSRRWLYGVA